MGSCGGVGSKSTFLITKYFLPVEDDNIFQEFINLENKSKNPVS